MLAPEYRLLPDGDPQRRFVELLTQGSEGALENRWATDIGYERGGESSNRDGEALVFGLSEAFWDASDRVVYERTAQLVYTVAALEAGKQVLLLRNGVPARAVRPGGEQLDLYLERADFADIAPWIEIGQPVAGATVGRTIPVSFSVSKARAVRVDVLSGGSVLKSVRLTSPGGSLRMPANAGADAATVRFSQGSHWVDVPVRVAAR